MMHIDRLVPPDSVPVVQPSGQARSAALAHKCCVVCSLGKADV